MASIDATTLRQLLRLDRATGKLYWLPRPVSMFPDERAAKTWNTRYAGAEALTADNGKGYKYGVVLYQRVYAHHVVWCLEHGDWPKQQIDHIDRNRANNVPVNLRDVSRTVNMRNTGMRRNNTSGERNVSWDKTRGLWMVRVRPPLGAAKNVGRFERLQDAVEARDAAEAMMEAA